MEKVPNFHFLDKLLRNPLPQKGFAPMKAIMITGTDPAKIMHNENGPPLSSPGLNAIPKCMLNRYAHVRIAKHTILKDGCQSNLSPSFIDRSCLVPNGAHKCNFFAKVCKIPYLRPVKFVVSQEVSLPLVYHMLMT